MHGEDGIIRTLLSRAAGAAGAPDPRQATSARWSSSGTVQKMSVEIVSSSSSALHTPEDVQAHTGAACTRADTDPEIQSSPSATARARRTQLLREEAHGGIAGRHSSDRHAVMAISPEHTCLGPLLAPPLRTAGRQRCRGVSVLLLLLLLLRKLRTQQRGMKAVRSELQRGERAGL